jgi:predicted DNA binding protein
MVVLRPRLNLTSVDFTMVHWGCWSQLTSDHRVTVRTLAAKIRGDVIVGVDEVRSSSSSEFRSFLRDFKRNPKVMNVMDVTAVDQRKRIYRVWFMEDHESMIMGVLHNFTVLWLRDLIADGTERVYMVLPEVEVEPLRNELQRIGKLIRFKTRRTELDAELFTSIDLSPQERLAMSEAVKRGYYDVPRRLDLRKLASQIGVSKPTLEEYLRKAERKILTKALQDIEFYMNSG